MMFVLQIDYPAKDYSAWKKLFDSDPAGRERSGVQRYRVMRGTDNPNLAIVELEFEQRAQAEKLLTNLKPIWERAQKDGVVVSPTARIVDLVETKELVTA
jgi:hypothetical protein